MKKKNIEEIFFTLLRAGLWEISTRLIPFEPLDFDALFTMAEDQSVVGLLAAGLEHVEDRKISKKEALPFVTEVYSLENRNASMNSFIGEIVEMMRNVRINPLLIKGQGVAQCYERPQWRASGDIDFLLENEKYTLAKKCLLPLAESSQHERVSSKHFGMKIDSWTVELHGTLHCRLSSRMDRVIDAIQEDTFTNGNVRPWRNGEMDVFLPGPNNDVIFIFSHILKHFYKGGIGLRQICDWCRLLWTYRDSIDVDLLKRRLRLMGLTGEWKAFAAYSVVYLGMPTEAMPLFDLRAKWLRKAKRIQRFILRSGNFGHKRDMGYYEKYPYLVRKTVSLGRRLGDLWRHAFIFPWDSVRFLPGIVFNGIKSAVRGE